MRTILLGCVAVLPFLSAGTAADDKKPTDIDVKDLVGKWEPKVEKENRTVVIEFAADGKLTMSFDRRGEKSRLEGTYQVEKNKVTVTLKVAGVDRTRVLTVSKFTDRELVGTDENGKEDALVRLGSK